MDNKEFASAVARQIAEFPVLSYEQIALLVYGMLQGYSIVTSDEAAG